MTRPLVIDVRPHQRAIVVFTGAASFWWLKILRAGFRHCFVVVEGDGGCLLLNSLSHRLELAFLPEADIGRLAAWYRCLGYRVRPATVGPSPKQPASFAPLTCVEAAKRLLGIRALMVLTPWQLAVEIEQTRKNMINAKKNLDFPKNLGYMS